MNNITTSHDVIQVEHLSKAYGEVKAVQDVTFNVRRGEIFGLLGPNGAGKTTTLSIIEGLRRADGGSVAVLQMDIDQDAPSIKQRIGVQLQSTSLLPDLTAVEQVELMAQLYGKPVSREGALSMLDQVGLADKANAFPGKLSGGQRQRLALALALVNDPELIFLDEPTTGLDPQSRRVLWEMIQELQAQGRTIILTTHYMEEAETLCHRVGIIDHGQLIALDTPAALISRLEGLSSITTSAYLPLDELHLLPGVATVRHEGESIRIQTADVIATLEALMKLAGQHDTTLSDLHIQQPSLEDVFLNLTGRTIRN